MCWAHCLENEIKLAQCADIVHVHAHIGGAVAVHVHFEPQTGCCGLDDAVFKT